MMAAHVYDVESRLREAVAKSLGSARFGLWFGEGVRLGIVDDTLEVGVPNAYFREWIQGHFAADLIDAGQTITGRALRLAFHVDDEAEPRVGDLVEPTFPQEQRGPKIKVPTTAVPQVPPQECPKAQVRTLRRLDDFVVGPCNQLAHAAATAMAESAGRIFNPLVIHGGVGLGKSHLLEGLGHSLRSRHPGLRIIQVTAEAFTNSFLDALRGGVLPSFRSRYRTAGALIVDDVHFLAAKRATHEEFLHTFNALVGEGAAIVLATDQHPRQIAKLPEELTTRFLAGMVVKLETPDLVTRRAILKAKAVVRGVDLPDAVVNYVAEHLRTSVRELEGALHSLVAHAALTGKRLDLILARAALRDTIRHTSQAIALRDVERAVSQLFQVDSDSLKSDSRTRALAYPRMIAMYLARKHTGAAYNEIGRYFGGRNHSTVISAEKKVIDWLRDEERNGLLAGFETISDILSALEQALGT